MNTNESKDISIIEMFGLPASGKTSFKSEFVGDSFIDFSSKRNSFNKKTKIIRLATYLLLALKNFKLVSYLMLKEKPDRFQLQQLADYLITGMLYDKYKSETKYVVSDQGLIQSVSAFYLRGNLSINSYFIKHLLSRITKYRLFIVYCKIDEDKGIQRLMNRTGNLDGYFDNIKNLELLDEKYKKMSNNILFLSRVLPNDLTLDMRDSLKKNVDYLINNLRKKEIHNYD